MIKIYSFWNFAVDNGPKKEIQGRVAKGHNKQTAVKEKEKQQLWPANLSGFGRTSQKNDDNYSP